MIKISEFRELYSLRQARLAAMCEVYDKKTGKPRSMSKQTLAYRESNDWMIAKIDDMFYFNNPKERGTKYTSKAINGGADI